jgi:hypothetical protein
MGYYDDSYDENSNWKDIDPDTEYVPIITEADRRAKDMEHIFINLHGKLVTSKVIESGGPDGHDSFADLMARSTFKSRSWEPTTEPDAMQLEAITQEWHDHLARTTGNAQLQNIIWTFNKLTDRSYHAASHDEQDRFTAKYLAFCQVMGYDPVDGMPSANYNAFRN